MTREELASIMYFLASAVNKDVPEQQLEVYFDLLGDLPAAAVQAAARQALLESAYPTLPPVGTLRRLATAAVNGPAYPSGVEAYRLVLAVVNQPARLQARELAALPLPVQEAARALGLEAIGSSEQWDTCRAHFLRAYEVCVGRTERTALLPPALRQAIAQIGQMPALQGRLRPEGERP